MLQVSVYLVSSGHVDARDSCCFGVITKSSGHERALLHRRSTDRINTLRFTKAKPEQTLVHQVSKLSNLARGGWSESFLSSAW